jgi:hypothetical protein
MEKLTTTPDLPVSWEIKRDFALLDGHTLLLVVQDGIDGPDVISAGLDEDERKALIRFLGGVVPEDLEKELSDLAAGVQDLAADATVDGDHNLAARLDAKRQGILAARFAVQGAHRG